MGQCNISEISLRIIFSTCAKAFGKPEIDNHFYSQFRLVQMFSLYSFHGNLWLMEAQINQKLNYSDFRKE